MLVNCTNIPPVFRGLFFPYIIVRKNFVNLRLKGVVNPNPRPSSVRVTEIVQKLCCNCIIFRQYVKIICAFTIYITEGHQSIVLAANFA